MKISDFVNVIKLNKEDDIQSAFENGKLFKYEKRGNINYVFHNGDGMRYLTYLEFTPNNDRGNHYHNQKEESMIVLKGKLNAKYYLVDNPYETLELTLEEGDIVNIKPRVAHVYLSADGASAIEFSPQKLDYNDQIKVQF